MGIIRSGTMISAAKSAGGLNYYKRKGVQCFRNKATLPADHVPTEAQSSQQTVYRLARQLLRGSAAMRWMVRNGFGESTRGGSQSAYNAAMSVISLATSRTVEGELLDTATRSQRRAELAMNAADFYSRYCDLNRSKYRFLAATSVTLNSNGRIIVYLSGLAWRAYKRDLVKRSAEFNVPESEEFMPAIVWMIGGQEITPEIPFNIQTAQVEPDGGLIWSIEGAPQGPVTFQYAFYFQKNSTPAPGELIDGAITRCSPRVYFENGEAPPGAGQITRFLFNNEQRDRSQPVSGVPGDQLRFDGTNLDPNDIFAFADDGSAVVLSSIATIAQSSATVVACTVSVAFSRRRFGRAGEFGPIVTPPDPTVSISGIYTIHPEDGSWELRTGLIYITSGTRVRVTGTGLSRDVLRIRYQTTNTVNWVAAMNTTSESATEVIGTSTRSNLYNATIEVINP